LAIDEEERQLVIGASPDVYEPIVVYERETN
jgi:hypothetical protein